MDKAQFTLILMTRDRPELAPLALESLLNQSDQISQVLIYDSGVKPLDVLSLRSKMPNMDFAGVRYHRADPSLTMPQNLNAAAKQVNTPHMVYLCDDDLLNFRWVGALSWQLSARGEVGAAVPRTNYIDENGKVLREGRMSKSGVLSAEEFGRLRYHWDLEFCVSGLCFKTEVFHEMGGFPETADGMSCDELLLLKMAGQKKLVVLNVPGVSVRQWPGSVSGGRYEVTARLKQIDSIEKSLNDLSADPSLTAGIEWLRKRNALWRYEMMLEAAVKSASARTIADCARAARASFKQGVGARTIFGLSRRKVAKQLWAQ